MDKLDHLGWVVSSSYAIGDARFAVRSTSETFGAWLRGALGAIRGRGRRGLPVPPSSCPSSPSATGRGRQGLPHPLQGRVRDPAHAGPDDARTRPDGRAGGAAVRHARRRGVRGGVGDATARQARADPLRIRADAQQGRPAPGEVRGGAPRIDDRRDRRRDRSEVVPVQPGLELADGALDRVGELFPARGPDGLFFVDERARSGPSWSRRARPRRRSGRRRAGTRSRASRTAS